MCSVPGVPTPGSEVSVVITKVGINQHFGLVELWVNMNKDIKHVYEQMQEEIQLPVRSFCGPEGKAGELCLVRVEEKWHRARIISMKDEKYQMFLIDQAQRLSTTIESLAWGKDECFILPPEIESCVLANVLSIENNWPERAADFLQSLLGKEFKGLVQQALMPDRTILLDVPTISNYLCEEGVTKKILVDELKNIVLKCLNLPEDESIESITMEQSLKASSQIENGDLFFYPELFTNTFESVRVTEVIDPANIFCELLIFSKSIKTLTEQMNVEMNAQPDNKDSKPQTIGIPCAAKGIDGKWRRAILKQQITSNDSTVKVIFVDDGKSEIVQVENVRKLDFKFLRMPVVTYCCSLEGIIPDKNWTKDEIDRLKLLILNQNVVARFERHTLPDNRYSVNLYAPNAVSLNDLFLGKKEPEINGDSNIKQFFNGFAGNVASPNIFPKSLEHDTVTFTQNYGSPFTPMEMPLCDMLTVGASIGVKVSCISSASKFWCQMSQSNKKLDILMKDLQSHYASVHPKPLVDSICVARNPDNNLWYRAKIIMNKLSPEVEVRFIDYGETKRVPLHELRPIDPTFLRLDAQAFQCSLHNLPVSDASYATKELHKFIDTQNSSLNCIIKAVTSDKEGMILNVVDLQAQSESISHVLAEKLATQPKTYNQSSHNIDINSKEKISLHYSKTVHNFYCQLDRNLHLFQQVQNDIAKALANLLPSACSLTPNSLCVARYSDSNWYRGHLLETIPNFKVHFVDLGKTLILPKAEVRPFPHEAVTALTTPVLALSMGLFNIPNEIPQEINEWFAEKVVGHTLSATVIEMDQNGKLYVELFDGSKSLNAQVREKIVNIQVESRLCIESNMETDECETKVAQNSSQIPIFQSGGPDMEDWLVLDIKPQAQKEAPEQVVATTAMEVDSAVKTMPSKETASFGSLNKFAYKKPILSFNKMQEVYASSITSPDYFWCQCSNTEDLDKVNKLAQIEGKAVQDPFFPLLLLSGHPCLALYKSENLWCRAQVIEKNDKTFSVVFIDYGNEEDIDYKDVRPLSDSLLEVAPQAFLCCLDEMDEMGKKWKSSFLDKFYNTLEDKPLNVKVLWMGHNSEIDMPQYTVQIENIGLHKLLQKYGLSCAGDALSPKREIKTVLFSNPNALVGKTMKVYASSISSPGFFWGQYVDTAELDRISRIAQKSGWVEDLLFPESLAPGSPCLALYSSDKQWYRAQVLSREKDMFNVVFVDYGNEEKIGISSVRPMPPRLMEKEPQAFLCCLENFDEDTSPWEDRLYDAFHKLLLDKIINLKILSVGQNKEIGVPQYTVQFDFDVKDFCSRYHPLGSRQNVQESTQSTSTKAPEIDGKTCKYNKPQLVMNKTVKAYASSISGPEYFWCQYCDTAELKAISELAKSEGCTQYDPNFANNLFPGKPCLALFSEDNVWYRAQILSKNQDRFSVLFIDYGNETDVSIKNIRPMSSRLFEVLPQAFLCCLEGFDLTEGAWDGNVYDHFHNILVDNLLEVTPSCTVENQDTQLPQFVVQIQCGGLSVNKTVQKYWKVRSKIDLISSTLTQNLSISEPTTLDLAKLQALRRPSVYLNGTVQVFTTCIVDPHYFWCQFAYTDDLDRIAKLAQQAGKSQELPATLNVGDICLALFSSDNEWYRALISKKNGDTLTAVFIDYGNEAEVTIKDTRLMPRSLLEQPPQAFLSSLHGYGQTEGTWEDKGSDYFFDFVVDKRLKVTIATEEENKELSLPQYSVQVECEGTDVNKLMEKYWRGESSHKSNKSGSGMS